MGCITLTKTTRRIEEAPITITRKVVNVESKEVEISEGNYVLIRSKKQRRKGINSGLFGMVKYIGGYTNNENSKRVYFYKPTYRLRILEFVGIKTPEPIISQDMSIDQKSIEEIYVGLENIAKALQSWEGLEGHVGLIEELMERSKHVEIIENLARRRYNRN